MTSNGTEPDEFISKLEGRAGERIRKYRQLRADIADLECTVTSDDETVKVTVLPSGAVKNIELSARAVRRSSGELEHLLMETIRQAAAKAALQLAERVQDTVGDEFDVVGMVNARLPEISLDGDAAGPERSR
ncbi:YbaB/EbfC family nucleoid-associated protein [Actinomadura sp. 3N508]|uniref:YbaB/EbfC family nucleoid-associated protein n=1 Tax=Actinomadura sp. 3N508 TaxID=3375153 RepID=UPI00379CD8D0